MCVYHVFFNKINLLVYLWWNDNNNSYNYNVYYSAYSHSRVYKKYYTSCVYSLHYFGGLIVACMTTSYNNIILSCDYHMPAQKFIKYLFYLVSLCNCMCISLHGP